MKPVRHLKRFYYAPLRWLLLLLVVCLVSSCLQIDYYVTINRDGSESVVAKIVAVKEMDMTKMESQLKSHGYKTTREEKNDSIYITATQTFPAGKWTLPYPFAMTKDSVRLSQSYSNYFILKKYKLSASYVLDSNKINDYFKDKSTADADPPGPDTTQISSMMSSATSSLGMSSGMDAVPLRYHITIPGKIDSTNASKLVLNNMDWNYKLEGGETVNVTFSSTEWNYTYLIVVGLIVIAAIFILFARKKMLN